MRKFEWERKPSKKQPTSKENATIIRALNNFGRVPEQHELLDEVERLQQELQRKDNNWNELKKFLIDLQKLKGINQQGFSWGVCQEILDKIKELESK